MINLEKEKSTIESGKASAENILFVIRDEMSFLPPRVKEITFGEIVAHLRNLRIIPSPRVYKSIKIRKFGLKLELV